MPTSNGIEKMHTSCRMSARRDARRSRKNSTKGIKSDDAARKGEVKRLPNHENNTRIQGDNTVNRDGKRFTPETLNTLLEEESTLKKNGSDWRGERAVTVLESERAEIHIDDDEAS